MGNCISQYPRDAQLPEKKTKVINHNHYQVDQHNEQNDERNQKAKEPEIIRIRALYGFEGRTTDELSFKEGDKMELIKESDDLWWFVKHLRTRKSGYVPRNYVEVDDGRPTSLGGWFKVGRREASRLLMSPGNPSGTYLIRPSSDERSFALSVRYFSREHDEWKVTHYKIRMTPHGEYYISRRQVMSTMDDLIKHLEGGKVLCCQLTTPCPKQERPSVQFRDIEINRKSIRKIKKLGEGSFGEVWLAVWSKALEVAVKTLKAGSMDQQQFIEEARIMHKMQHPRIVQILGVCTTQEPIYIVTEFMSKGSLLEVLQKDQGATLTLNDLIDIMAQVAEGMAYLESKQFVHRDLRAANILMGKDKEVKVADFGLARITGGGVYSGVEQTRYPIKWTAPEVWCSRTPRVFSVKTDVWSYGVLMHEIVTFGRQPYFSMDNRTVMREVQNGYRLPDPTPRFRKSCTKELHEVMLQCWDAQPEARPTFRHLSDTFDDWQISTEIQYQDDYI